ncbi:unnamed protein product [Moneuplotes crassus]|uniref:Lebercilin domain-containing protein n=1 Tax=Euplotes crassus TaxID=5936 RepID=A0AAD1XY87_EUPCR|nr:unnamed protein product [Moneuplotes crassus]
MTTKKITTITPSEVSQHPKIPPNFSKKVKRPQIMFSGDFNSAMIPELPIVSVKHKATISPGFQKARVLKNSKDSDKFAITELNKSCAQKEISQLKKLNKKLVDEKCRLEEELLMLRQKETVQSMLLQINPKINSSKDSEIQHSLKHFTHKLKSIKDMEISMNKMKKSFTNQIEELQESLSYALQQTSLISQTKDHSISDLGKIIEKTKAKRHDDKKKIKWLKKKLDKLEKEYDKLADVHNQLRKDNQNLQSRHKSLEKTHKKDLDLIKDMSKKLYKMEAEGDLINLNPYDLHMKIRYYETQLDQKDQESIAMFKELKTIRGYLEVLGISEEELVKSAKTGYLNLNSFNAENFNMSYVKKKNNSQCKKPEKIRRNKSSRFIDSEKSSKSIFRHSKSNFCENTEDSQTRINCSETSSITGEVPQNTLSIPKFQMGLPQSRSRIHDFGQRSPTSNLDLLKHLEKVREASHPGQYPMNPRLSVHSSSSISSTDSFTFPSRKRNYDKKLKTTLIPKHLIE